MTDRGSVGTGARLVPGFWVRAQIRLCESRFIPAMVIRKGHEAAGSVLVKVDRFEEGCAVYSRIALEDGAPGWLRATGPEGVSAHEADAHIRRQLGYDPDLWVLEIEDRRGEYELDAPIVDL